MPSLLDLALPINENMLQGSDPNHRPRLRSFLAVRIKVRRMVDSRSLSIAMDVGQHCQDAGRVIPENLAACFSHRD